MNEINHEPLIIAFLGKGGTGKTILSAITAKILSESEKNVLIIDADPAMGLSTALEIEPSKTIGIAREEIIKQSRIASSKEEKERVVEIVDYLLLSALYEDNDFSMLVMGQTNTLGCYCPVNNLLRSTIESIAANYDAIIIDAEAGIEQINRQVVETVRYPVIVSDNSMRGVKTSIMAKKTIKSVPRMKPEKIGVIFNRVEEEDKDLIQKVTNENLLFYGMIPPDKTITEMDKKGISIMKMDNNAPSLIAMKEILSNIGIISQSKKV